MDLKNEEPGKSGLRKELTEDEAGELCPVDRGQPYQRSPVGTSWTGGCGRLRDYAGRRETRRDRRGELP
jgi:hypothetical protein